MSILWYIQHTCVELYKETGLSQVIEQFEKKW